MQSQQKRLKWSRGETAEALEERTDTGITQASVELMENCIPDLFGNISRRPALSLIPQGWQPYPGSIAPERPSIYSFQYDKYLQVILFYITETDIILIGIHAAGGAEYIRIKEGVCVAYNTTTGGPRSTTWADIPGVYEYQYKPVSWAQQNNYLIVSDDFSIYKIQFTFGSDNAFTPTVESFKYSAGWYAPNGTSTAQVTTAEVPGMNFDASSIGGYTYTEENGETTVYSWIKTGLLVSSVSGTWTGSTTSYYAHQTGTPRRNTANFWIDTNPTGGTWNSGPITMTNGTTYTNGQYLGDYTFHNINLNDTEYDYTKGVYLTITENASYISCTGPSGNNRSGITRTVDVSSNIGVPSSITALETYIPVGCIVQFPNNGAYMRVEGYDSDGTNLRMYGSFLTPVANANAYDDRVKIETGYSSLQPDVDNPYYPHPRKLLFSAQRLWAGAWLYELRKQYCIVLGSQIGRYTDFKNNYNEENEPITLDILTQFKENIVHLIDYNGVKIMTNSYEYAYDNGGITKQSANGSWENCEPIVFDSLCLYVDATGQQVKAMQYEFQSNIFNSSSINQAATADLIWKPISLSGYEDKIHSTGKYLFVTNEDSENNPKIAVCNFVPSNQAMIWNRWKFTNFKYVTGNPLSPIAELPLIHTVVHTKAYPIFMINVVIADKTTIAGTETPKTIPAYINFEPNADVESKIYTYNSKNYLNLASHLASGYSNYITILPQATVNVYANGEFQWQDTLDITGALTKDITGLTNVTIGIPIDATVRSHPIDVGGKTKSIKKRIGKTVMSVHDTEAGAITINGKTGYMNPQGDKISFYGVTGMKDEIRYTLTNKNGAMFHLESLLMNIEYGTLDS